ncbi:hypothetical protein VTN00DRAFT_8270 [Thermoascus crustaceus]|uniref:uncharacterized protein n=1 Tax=Thermoascus crustaceus TaxID=5088 RepID=UPI003743EF9D
MKFTGVVATLAVASTASAAAISARQDIQAQQALTATLTKVNGAVAQVDTLLGGLLQCATGGVDLNSVQTELQGVKAELQRLVPLPVKRDTLTAQAGQIVNEAGEKVQDTTSQAAGAVSGLTQRDDLTGGLGGLTAPVTGLVNGLLSTTALNNLQGLLANTPLAGASGALGQNLVQGLEQQLISPTQFVQALGLL